MRGILQYQFSGLRNAWSDGLKEECKRSAIAFCILTLLAFCACLTLPDLRTRAVTLILDTMNGIDAVKDDGTFSAPAIFSNNLRACAFTMVYGLLPFLQLPALALGVNALLLGVLAAWYVSEGFSILAYLAALLPHGILELPALILAFSMGLYVCGHLTRRCRGDENALRLWDCLVLISRLLLLVLIPLLAAAAAVEAYVTPAVASLFL